MGIQETNVLFLFNLLNHYNNLLQLEIPKEGMCCDCQTSLYNLLSSQNTRLSYIQALPCSSSNLHFVKNHVTCNPELLPLPVAAGTQHSVLAAVHCPDVLLCSPPKQPVPVDLQTPFRDVQAATAMH